METEAVNAEFVKSIVASMTKRLAAAKATKAHILAHPALVSHPFYVATPEGGMVLSRTDEVDANGNTTSFYKLALVNPEGGIGLGAKGAVRFTREGAAIMVARTKAVGVEVVAMTELDVVNAFIASTESALQTAAELPTVGGAA